MAPTSRCCTPPIIRENRCAVAVVVPAAQSHCSAAAGGSAAALAALGAEAAAPSDRGDERSGEHQENSSAARGRNSSPCIRRDARSRRVAYEGIRSPAIIAARAAVAVCRSSSISPRSARGRADELTRLHASCMPRVGPARATHTGDRGVAAADGNGCVRGTRPGLGVRGISGCGSRAGSRTLIIEDLKERPCSYQDLLKGALVLGRLNCVGTVRGENVGVLLPNAIPTVCTVLGLCAFGRVPAMLNYTAGPGAVQGACIAARVAR